MTDSDEDPTDNIPIQTLRESIAKYGEGSESPMTSLTAIEDGPIYFATAEEMYALPRTLRYLEPIVQRYGAVGIVPPESWERPEDKSANARSLKVSHQYLPYPPHAVPPLPEHSKFKTKNASRRLWHDENQDDNGLIDRDVSLRFTTVDMKDFKKTEEENAKKIRVAYGLSEIGSDCNSALIKIYESSFWHAKKYGVENRKMTVYYGNDQVKEDMEKVVERGGKNRLVEGVRKALGSKIRGKKGEWMGEGTGDVEEEVLDGEGKWWPGNINEAGVMNNIGYAIPGITESMFYVGGLFTFFGLHREDEDLNSLSYLHEGDPKVWYVVPPAHCTLVESYAANHVFAKAYVMQYQNGARQTILRKATLFNPQDMQSQVNEELEGKGHQRTFRAYRFIQFANMMVYTAKSAYHYGFNAGFNVAETVNYGDRTWFETSRAYARKSLYEKLDISVNLPWEYMLHIELGKACKEIDDGKKMDFVDIEGIQVMENLLRSVMKRAEAAKAQFAKTSTKKLCVPDEEDEAHPFWSMDKFGKLGWQHKDYVNKFHCAYCGHNPYFYMQICMDDLSPSNVFCLRHVTLEQGAVCQDRSHRIAVLERFPMSYLDAILGKMAGYLKGKTVPRMKMRPKDVLKGKLHISQEEGSQGTDKRTDRGVKRKRSGVARLFGRGEEERNE